MFRVHTLLMTEYWNNKTYDCMANADANNLLKIIKFSFSRFNVQMHNIKCNCSST